jgi:hypothetical protein
MGAHPSIAKYHAVSTIWWIKVRRSAGVTKARLPEAMLDDNSMINAVDEVLPVGRYFSAPLRAASSPPKARRLV